MTLRDFSPQDQAKIFTCVPAISVSMAKTLSDASVLEQPRKNRKSRGGGGLENAFSGGKAGERKGEKKKRQKQRRWMGGKMVEKESRTIPSLAKIK